MNSILIASQSLQNRSGSLFEPRLGIRVRLVSTGLSIAIGAFTLIAFVLCLVFRENFMISGGCSLAFVSWALLFLSVQKATRPAIKNLNLFLCLVMAIVSLSNLAKFLCDLDTVLAQPLVRFDDFSLNFPGPLLPDAALSFLVLFVATILLSQFPGRPNFHKIAAMVLLIPNVIEVGTSVAGLQSICTAFGCMKPSIIASSLFTLAGLTVLFAMPYAGMTFTFVSETVAGKLARSILIAFAACLPLVGLVMVGHHIDLYDSSIALGLVFVAIAGTFTFGVGHGVKEFSETQPVENVAPLQPTIAVNASSSQSVNLKLLCLECGHNFDDASISHCPSDGAELKRIEDGLKIGSTYCERYEILEFVGAGGCATIYKARHILLNSQVALKLLRSRYASEAKYVQRFQRESKATFQLSHPNIVTVHDFGVSDTGQPYIVMDFLKGRSLDEIIDSFGPVPWRQSVDIFIDICEGLAYAHRQGVLHRDLKPSNIMLLESDRWFGGGAKIVDFGLAKMLNDTQGDLTQTGELIGSPTYMSPEQCRGDELDNRTDIYSLGSLMYHALSGHPAVTSSTIFETLRCQVSDPPAPFQPDLQLPVWLSNVVYKTLEKQTTERPQTVESVLSSLRRGLSAETQDLSVISN